MALQTSHHAASRLCSTERALQDLMQWIGVMSPPHSQLAHQRADCMPICFQIVWTVQYITRLPMKLSRMLWSLYVFPFLSSSDQLTSEHHNAYTGVVEEGSNIFQTNCAISSPVNTTMPMQE